MNKPILRAFDNWLVLETQNLKIKIKQSPNVVEGLEIDNDNARAEAIETIIRIEEEVFLNPEPKLEMYYVKKYVKR